MSILELYMANSIDNTAGKIREKLNTVRNKRKASAKRCIWEMMQNAKDVYNPKYGGVSIEFEVADEHTFVFRHNGLHFSLKDVTCLIQQVSSKSSTNEDENVTGMFGTGFITTHLIADVIDVKSILIDGEDRFRHFDLRLDRSGSSKEELAPRIEKAMKEFAKLDNDSSGELFPFVTDFDQHTENDFDTSFTYRIETESQLQLALLGINDLVNTLPVTMINLPKVKSVRVINRLEGTDVRYTCTREEKDENVVLSTIANEDITKQYLSYTTNDVSLSIEIKDINGEWFAVKRDDKLPVLLRDFPLIGSHQFYFPYFLNGFRFIPTEARDDIQLHGDSDDKPSVINRNIIEKAVESALVFNAWLINHNIHNRYLLASSRIPKSTETWDEETSEPWIKNLQKNWRAELLKQNLLESEDGFYPMSEMLLPDCSKKESRETFWDILRPVTNRKLPKRELIHEWREIMVEYDSWNCSIKYPLEKFLEDLSNMANISWALEKFNGDETTAFEWFNKVIKFTFSELGSDAFDKYAILPNQKGEFKKSSELRRDNTQPIPEDIKNVYRIAFEKDIKDNLLNSSIDVTYLISIKEYNLTSLIRDLNTFIKDSNKKFANRRDASYALTQIYSGEGSIELRKTMYYLCSGFSKKVSTFTKIDSLPIETWSESDRFLLCQIPVWIAESDKCTSLSMVGSVFLTQFDSIDDTKIIDWINQYLKVCADVQCTSQLANYAIFPNQNGNLKKYNDLFRDNTQPIPEEIKDVYRIAFEKDIKDKLVNSTIDVAFVTAIKEYNLSNIIRDLNTFIKDSSKQYVNRRDASYALTQLYSGEDSMEHRKTMYYLCSGFSKKVTSFTKIDNLPDEIWTESDRFLIGYIPYWIEKGHNCTSLSMIGSNLLTQYESIDEDKIIDWLNQYLKVCKDIQCSSQITNYAFFPSQSGKLYKIGELSYDNNIPEEIKDLSEIAQTKIAWRSSLLDKRIEGYSLNSPKTVSDIYRSIADAFDKSSQQLTIAKHAIALNYNDNPDLSYMQAILAEIYDDMPDSKVLINADGFDWEKFIACAIVGISGEVASKINIAGLAASLSTETHEYDTNDCIAWVDKFLNFVFNYRGGRYKSKVTELSNHGIWVNQSEDFCMFSDLSRDGGIAESLKDLAANNPIVNFKYRDILLHNNSTMSSAIDKDKTITQNAVLTRIDESLEGYKADKQALEFRSLIFDIMELDKSLHISDQMKFYKQNKEKLIVGSLGEGDTMKMVAGIIQQGDDKIRAIKEILEGNTLKDLEIVKDVLHGCPLEKMNLVKEFIDKISSGESPDVGGETPTGGDDKVKQVFAPETYELDVVNYEGEIQHVIINEVQYAGLSREEIKNYVEEAKAEVVKYFKELNERENLGLQFDMDRIKSYSYSQLYGIYKKDGTEIPLVVHSYKGPQFRYFNLNYFDWLMLSRPGSMLWVLTVSGLQCIPLYALPVRNFNFSIDSSINIENRAAFLTLAQVGMQYDQFGQISFDFGNNMPHGFIKPVDFNYVPDELEESVNSIKEVCDSKLPLLTSVYNTAMNIPIVPSLTGYSRALKEVDTEQTQREIYESAPNDMKPPVKGTSFID